MAAPKLNYAVAETQILLDEIRRTRERVAEWKDIVYRAFSLAPPGTMHFTHPLTDKLKTEELRLHELEKLLATVPMDLLPTTATTIYPSPVHPQYGPSPLPKASLIAALSKDIEYDYNAPLFINPPYSNSKNPDWTDVGKVYDQLKILAQKSGIPIATTRQKATGKKDDVSNIQTLGPLGFKVLKTDPKLFYKIEEDGGVLITGDDSRKCLFNTNIVEGGKVIGGVKVARGAVSTTSMLFGDRITHENGVEKKYPLRWCPVSTVAQLPPLSQRRIPRDPHPWKQPALQNIPMKRDQIPDMLNKGLISKETALKELVEEENDIPNRKSRLAAIFGKSPRTDGKSPWSKDDAKSWMNQEQVDKLVRERNEVGARLDQMMKQNELLKTKLRRAEQSVVEVKNAAETELTAIREEFRRKQNTHRLQIEAVRSNGVTVEGMDSVIFEMEDPNNTTRYLVVASIPSNTPSNVQRQWMDDLQRLLDERFGEGIVQYFIAPDGVSISVLEVMPGVEDQDDDNDLIQF